MAAAVVVDSPSTSCLSDTLKLLKNDNLKNDNTDVQDFQKRIKTYILDQKWVRKPFSLSPPVCARFGWECCGPNKLRCVSCSAILCTSLPEMENSKSYDKCTEDVLKSLKTSHRKHCPWPLAPCPESFFKMFPIRKEAAFEDLVSRLESLLPIEKCLPQVKDSVARSLALSEDNFKTLCELSHIPNSPFSRSSILLAATGWRRMPDAGKKKYITCVNCERTVGVWFYLPVQPEVTENCIPKQKEETNELLSASHLSSDTTQDTSPCANSHTSDECNDGNVNTGTSSSQDCLEVLLCKQESATSSESSVHQNGKRLDCGDSSCISEDQAPPRKKFCLETNEPFDPLYEHRPWCMWISKTSCAGISESSTEVGSSDHKDSIVPGYKVYIECLLRNVGNSSSASSSLSSPTKEQLNKARELLVTWSSPA